MMTLNPIYSWPCCSSAFSALQCARSMNVNKIVSSSSDCVAVVLFGTVRGRGGSDGGSVHVLQDLGLPGDQRIMELDRLTNGDGELEKLREEVGISTTFSLVNALFQCRAMFAATHKKSKLYSKRILLFTCRDRPPAAGSDALKRHVFQSVQDVRSSGATIDLFPLGEGFSMDAFYSEVLFDENSDEPPPTAVVSSKLDELLTRVRQKSHKKRAIGKIPFILGEGVKLAVGVYNLVRSTPKPSSVRVEQTTNAPLTGCAAEVNESTSKPLLRSEIDYTLTYGGQKIAFNSDEVREMRTICEPGLVLLGFRPATTLDGLQHVQPASFVYPEEARVKGSRQLFTALLRRCEERRLVAICRLVSRRNDTPHLVALQPQMERTEGGVQIAPPGFHVIFLPFADDIRQLSLPEPTRATDEQIEAARAIVMKLRFKYSPDKIENPSLQKHWINIEAIALNRQQPDEFVDYTAPDVERIEKKAGSLIANFKELVSLDGDPDPSPAAKRARRDPVDVDMKALAEARKVNTAKVDELKAFLKSVGQSVGTKKKAELVEAVYNHFES
ncbi:X-ray repair cross-complementing protein 6-like isoform X2 [Amphibalanus amphitrite]|uniref:X-ray repair cross-complementing protein 6-like isoform X2 n=1 Tax=Amphibalanus amphitrite TaxID=1232801 RepID=UPI001C920C33|nr:X-ray repair cross-complementing protein 6-like isoform X2 [Amphibalanus amphitrite]XP_043199584.1 X-ray repair cross-complementing protein 6-like isoform X2 [Amphibalanus amphitrite]XP_043222595.1 X-ray repair cross-complementing protein 6-like isoform X2 [Amphibalanus amphitrite]